MPVVYKNIGLTTAQEDVIEKLLRATRARRLNLEDVWTLMDRVWDKSGCDNRTSDPEKLAKFYLHPVWILNGLLVEHLDLSKQHRDAISDWIVSNRQILGLHKIIDYGGGFGSLARLVACKDPAIQIDVFEPHPSNLAQARAKQFTNIRYIQSLDRGYNCLISTDVLEHLSDPLKTLAEMIDSVRLNGYLLIATNFFPVIKCHLPGTFHLRYTFDGFARVFGLAPKGGCRGSHATIFRKISARTLAWKTIRRMERISKTLFPCLESLHKVYRNVRQRVDKNYAPQHPLKPPAN
jgi:2-polyprenyl-6-hydroxyphenyl methylase/3-demethylubiquinone-9 3-methyltransferase